MVPGDYAGGRSGFISVPAGKIYYEVKGAGKAMVFIHSAVSDSRVWEKEFTALSSKATVIRYDVRGFGRSSPATGSYSDFQDLKILLSSLGITNVCIVAASNSGRIALDFAIEYPDAVDGLVLIGSGLGLFDFQGNEAIEAEAKDFEKRFSSVAESYRAGDKEKAVDMLLELFAPAVTGTGRELARTLMLDNIDEIMTDSSASYSQYRIEASLLSKIRAPVVVIAGEKDHPVIRWSSRRLAEEIHDGSFRIVENGDHFTNLSAADAIMEILSSCL